MVKKYNRAALRWYELKQSFQDSAFDAVRPAGARYYIADLHQRIKILGGTNSSDGRRIASRFFKTESIAVNQGSNGSSGGRQLGRKFRFINHKKEKRFADADLIVILQIPLSYWKAVNESTVAAIEVDDLIVRLLLTDNAMTAGQMTVINREPIRTIPANRKLLVQCESITTYRSRNADEPGRAAHASISMQRSKSKMA